MKKPIKNREARPIIELFAACCEEFRAEINALADAAGLPVLEVFALWREYSAKCYDQSALVWEFKRWYRKPLRMEKGPLAKFMDGPGDLENEIEYYREMSTLEFNRSEAAEILVNAVHDKAKWGAK